MDYKFLVSATQDSAGSENAKIKIEVEGAVAVASAEIASTDTDNPTGTLFEVTGLDAALTTTGGTSDARFFKDYCEVAEFGLIGETAHQVDENVKITDIGNLEKIYYSILKKYFHKMVLGE